MVTPELEQAPDLTCTACGYSLYTLDVNGRCPECGQAISESVGQLRRRRERFGPALSIQAPVWLRVCASGILLTLAAGIVQEEAFRFLHAPYHTYAIWACEILQAIGLWLITIPPIESTRVGNVLRWCSRVAVALWFVSDEASFVAVATIIGFAYLAHLAGRMKGGLVRRVFLVLTGLSLLTTVIASATEGAFRDIRLPDPASALAGDFRPILEARSTWRLMWWNGDTRKEFLEEYLLPVAWTVVSDSALLWFAVILAAKSVKRILRRQ
jgi:hypothetical protein